MKLSKDPFRTTKSVKDDYGHYIPANTKVIEGNYLEIFKETKQGDIETMFLVTWHASAFAWVHHLRILNSWVWTIFILVRIYLTFVSCSSTKIDFVDFVTPWRTGLVLMVYLIEICNMNIFMLLIYTWKLAIFVQSLVLPLFLKKKISILLTFVTLWRTKSIHRTLVFNLGSVDSLSMTFFNKPLYTVYLRNTVQVPS